MNEADTCRTLVRPRLEAAGWLANDPPEYEEQQSITDGRVVLTAGRPKRQPPLKPDFLLRYRAGIRLAVVEAKAIHRPASAGRRPSRCRTCSAR